MSRVLCNAYLAIRKLFFGCYQPINKKHNAKSCKQSLTYKLYGELHLTGFHEYKKNKNDEDHESAQSDKPGTYTILQ